MSKGVRVCTRVSKRRPRKDEICMLNSNIQCLCNVLHAIYTPYAAHGQSIHRVTSRQPHL